MELFVGDIDKETSVLLWFLCGFFFWALFILHNKLKGSLTEIRFHYSYLIIIFGYFNIVLLALLFLFVLWDKIGKVIADES